MVMEPQQQVPTENGTSNGPTSPNGARKRNFANKLGTLRTYKEIPPEDLAKGDLIKQVIRPRGKPLPDEESLTPIKLDFASPPGSPGSPTTIVKATPDKTDSSSTDGTKGQLDLQKVSAMRKNNFTGEKRNVSWNDSTTIHSIATTKYLEQLEAENAKLKTRGDTIYKELGVVVQERDAIEKERDQLIEEKAQLQTTIQQNTNAQNHILEKTSRTLVEYEIQIEDLQATVSSLQQQLANQPETMRSGPAKLQSQPSLNDHTSNENQLLKDQIKQLQQKLEGAMAMLKQMTEEKAAAAPLSPGSQTEQENSTQSMKALQATNNMLQQSLKQRDIEFENFKKTLPSQGKMLFYTQIGLWIAVIFLLTYILANGGFSLPEEFRAT